MGTAFLINDARASTLRALNYTPQIERLRNTPRRRSTVLRELLSEMGPAYGTVFTRIDCAPEHGIELLSQTDMFSAEPQGRVIRRDSMSHPERHEIKKGQVLIAGAGTLGENEIYGRSLIADGRLTGKYVGPDSMTLVFKEPGGDRSLFTYAFLAGPTGVAAIRSTSYGTKLLRFREDLLGSLPVPLCPVGVEKRVADLVRHCITQRELYLEKLQAARLVIERLPEMRAAYSMCAGRKARCVVWNGALRTLSAWNTASTGGALSYLQSKWTSRLSDILEPRGLYNGPRFARIGCKAPHGLDFLSQRDVFLIRPVPRRIAHPGFADRMLFAADQTIMVGAQGTLGEGEIFGRVALIRNSATRAAYTQHLLRIVTVGDRALETFAFLSTVVGLQLLRSTAVGTKLLSMRGDLLRELPIPELEEHARMTVRQAIEEALAAREAAQDAEKEAIRIVEEEVLPAWLA